MRSTLKLPGTHSSSSETSSPSGRNRPPHSPQASCFGGVGLYFARQMFGQWLTCRFRRGDWVRSSCRNKLGSRTHWRDMPWPSPVLPASVPVARSAAPASPTCDQTACAAAWRSAASDARSRSDARATDHAAIGSALSVPRHRVDPGQADAVRQAVTRGVCQQLGVTQRVSAQKAVQIGRVNLDR